MSEPTEKQIKKWNKDINAHINILRKVHRLTNEVNRERQTNKHDKNYIFPSQKELDKWDRKLTAGKAKILAIPAKYWYLTDMAKLKDVMKNRRT